MSGSVMPIQTERPPVKGAFPQVFPDLCNIVAARVNTRHERPALGKASSGITPERRSTASPRPRETRAVAERQGGVDDRVKADLGRVHLHVLSEPREERQTHLHRSPATGGVCLATALLPAPHQSEGGKG